MEKGQKVLIIEDDQMIIEMYRDKLKSEGFRVLIVNDGKKAIQRIKQGADLILLDLLLPGMNGFEILKRIKSDAETKKIHVIVLTNIGSESIDSDRKLAMSLGAEDYMIKSLNTPEDILKRIKALL
jgi:DNA-binding response OmpR family regulator